MGKNGVATFSRLYLIGSISYLQVIMTYMRAWMSLKLGQSRLLVSMATDRVIIEKNRVATSSRLFFIRSFSYLQVMYMHKSLEEFEIRPDLTTSCPLTSKKSP